MPTPISSCRICGNSSLEPVLDLGVQALTGVFPKSPDEPVGEGPLRLVKCVGDYDQACGLLQLEHSYDIDEMYGENYGYRSGLNASMVAHLHRKVERISGLVDLVAGDLVIDIGSNDATTLKAYTQEGLQLVGVDPTGTKFREYYPDHITLIPDFFSADLVRDRFGDRKAKVVTSFSMFYDLEAPMDFMEQVAGILADDGIWVFEQSYMPAMLETNSFDTVCHEHLEFYALKQIQWMADRVGLAIEDVEFNDVNGGSFSVTVRKSGGTRARTPQVEEILRRETDMGLDILEPFRAFERRVKQAREEIRGFVCRAKAAGKTVAGLGASTKGNVLLQYCGLTADDLVAVGEVNPDKFGAYTPGSHIPIVSERDLLARSPDYLLVLPWHFRAFFEQSPKFADRTLVYPLPRLGVVEE
ncbi:class I SAM-dependent methyltransferase [Tsuneonella amylolytica]|uniref:class I SAM-dependent methyltransferase n=1 Tax=Tsuneonella amylolytica TaxID=2338327 RepID=UPI000EAAB68F|nr:class I SAM-dependent methyltransferase [Tsuneonella amylolytica]